MRFQRRPAGDTRRREASLVAGLAYYDVLIDLQRCRTAACGLQMSRMNSRTDMQAATAPPIPDQGTT